jgi:hypothetical protein
MASRIHTFLVLLCILFQAQRTIGVHILVSDVLQVVKKFKMQVQREAKAAVKDLGTGRSHVLYMYWMHGAMELYLGKKKEGGRLLAECEAKNLLKSKRNLSIKPGMDAAVCVIMHVACLLFDQK